MRIILPLYLIGSAGVQRSTLELLKYLCRKIEKIILIIPKDVIPLFESELPNRDKVILKASDDLVFKWLPHPFRSPVFHLLTHLREIYLIKKHGITHMLHPFESNIKPRLHAILKVGVPVAVIAHDMNWLDAQGGGKQDNLHMLRCISAVDMVFAVSKQTLNELKKITPNSNNKYQYIPWATINVNREYKGKNKKEKDEFTFYYPAMATGNKNHLLLFKAIKKLIDKGYKFKLVLTGININSFYGVEEIKRKRAEEARLYYKQHEDIFKEFVRFMGYVSFDQVEKCYENSDYVVLPTLYEGYGLPLIEAVSRNIPVIASDIPVLREQAGRYQLDREVTFFKADDLDQFVACMEKALSNPQNHLDPKIIADKMALWGWENVADSYIKALSLLK